MISYSLDCGCTFVSAFRDLTVNGDIAWKGNEGVFSFVYAEIIKRIRGEKIEDSG